MKLETIGTHGGYPPRDRVPLAVGCERRKDILADIDQALAAAR